MQYSTNSAICPTQTRKDGGEGAFEVPSCVIRFLAKDDGYTNTEWRYWPHGFPDQGDDESNDFFGEPGTKSGPNLRS